MQPIPDVGRQRATMPRILDYPSPEEYSEALRAAGYLPKGIEGVLTDVAGVLRPAHYRHGHLEFDDPTMELSGLYETLRTLRPDAAARLRNSLRWAD